jgi:hypothetical protein
LALVPPEPEPPEPEPPEPLPPEPLPEAPPVPLVPPDCAQPINGIENINPKVNGRKEERGLRCIRVSPSG